MNFEDFKNMIEGKGPQPMTTNMAMGPVPVPVPNMGMFNMVPGVGGMVGGLASASMNLATDVSSGVAGATLGAAFGGMSGLNDEQLKQKFDEIDTDKSGKLSAKEVGSALRKQKVSEADIRKIVLGLGGGGGEVDFEGFKALVKPLCGEKSIHDTPGVGHLTGFMSDSMGSIPGMDMFGFAKMSPEEMKKAFDKIDKDGSGTLDKTEIADALREMKKSDREIQRFIEGMKEPELDFDAFKEMLQGGKPAEMTSDMGGGMMGGAFGDAFGKLTDAELRV